MASNVNGNHYKFGAVSYPPNDDILPFDQTMSMCNYVQYSSDPSFNGLIQHSNYSLLPHCEGEETTHEGLIYASSMNDTRRNPSIDDGRIIENGRNNTSSQFRQKVHKPFGDRSSIYRGVCRYGRRYEAFLWDNTNEGKKSKTIYVGGFEQEEDAARAYDLAALKLWGTSALLNFSLNNYYNDLEDMRTMSKKEYLLTIRRKSKGFAIGSSSFRGVSRKKSNKNSKYVKWQARLGKGSELKGIYLGTFDSEEEAAVAYDVASIRLKGERAVTNYAIDHYNVQAILQSPTVPIGKGASKLIRTNTVEALFEKKKNANHQKHSSDSDQEPVQDPDNANITELPLFEVPFNNETGLNHGDYPGYGFNEETMGILDAEMLGYGYDPRNDELMKAVQEMESRQSFQSLLSGSQFVPQSFESAGFGYEQEDNTMLHTNPEIFQGFGGNGNGAF